MPSTAVEWVAGEEWGEGLPFGVYGAVERHVLNEDNRREVVNP